MGKDPQRARINPGRNTGERHIRAELLRRTVSSDGIVVAAAKQADQTILRVDVMGDIRRVNELGRLTDGQQQNQQPLVQYRRHPFHPCGKHDSIIR